MPVGGQWRGAASGERLDCIDPTTEELLGTVPAGGAADADLAVRAAREASGAWRALGWTRRAALLRDLAAAVAEVAGARYATPGLVGSRREFARGHGYDGRAAAFLAAIDRRVAPAQRLAA
jgi:hypothetical protein